MQIASDAWLNQDFNLFHFKILALMACRGSAYDKAGYLFDLVRAKQEVVRIGTHKFNSGQENKKDEEEVDKKIKADNADPTLAWSNSRLKHSIEMLLVFSELLPKMFYLKL
jgi:hypothetical protein